MSTFASIAVLSKPTELKPDWEFEMEGLKFAVHDGMVELNQEIHDFERFSSALNNVFLLIDSIESNKGKLDEAVYSLVNQNNELAEALGIYTPFNLKSDEGQRQAGFELCMAFEADENQNNDQKKKDGETSNEEDKGFFAKAWEAIKNFFLKIGRAIKKLFVSAEAKEKASDAKNAEANKKLDSMTPEEVRKAFEDAVKKQMKGLTLSKDLADAMVKSARTIAEKVKSVSESVKDTLSYFDLLLQNGSYAKILEPCSEELKKFGYTLVDTTRFGEQVKVPQKTGESVFRVEAQKRNDAIMSWSNDPRKLIGPSGSYRSEIKAISKQFKEDAATLEKLTARFSDEKKVENIIKQRGPSLVDRFSAWWGGKLDNIDMKKKVKLASDIGKDLAKALSILSGLFTECDNLMGATCGAIEGIILERKIREVNKDYKELNTLRTEHAEKENAKAAVVNDDSGAGI